MLPYTSMRDEMLFNLMKLDEDGAFKEIYERYFDGLFLHAYRKLHNKEEARDLTQEIFAMLWDKRQSITLTGSLPAYLFTAVRNRCINIFLRKEVESSYIQSLQEFIDAEVCQTDHLARTNQLTAIIDKELNALPSKMQEIFVLSRKDNLSHKEIAAQLNLSEQTVKKQVNNALKILRTKLGMTAN